MLLYIADSIKMFFDKLKSLSSLRKSKIFVNFIMPFLDFPISVALYGVKWKVQVRTLRDLSWVIRSKNLNPMMAPLFLAINEVCKPKAFWDVGANIGFFSWLLMSQNDDLEVVLFEPDPANIKLLQTTIDKANLSKVSLLEYAVSDTNSESCFAIDKITGATGTLEVSDKTFIQRQYGAIPQIVTVKTVTLDRIWKHENKLSPDLIKIDVEGSDERVFNGAMELIKLVQPIIVFECSSSKKTELTSRLKKLGYILFNAEELSGTVDNAYNLLALPARNVHLVEQLLKTWINKIEKYKIANPVSK